MKLISIITFFAMTLFLSSPSYSHSGGTNSSGCHNDYQNGGYHCHNSDNDSPATTINREPASSYSNQESEKQYCCKICRKGKACGNSCISRRYTCHQPPGCACDG